MHPVLEAFPDTLQGQGPLWGHTDLAKSQNPGGAGGRVQNRAIAPQLRSAMDFSIQALETSKAGELLAFPSSGDD